MITGKISTQKAKIIMDKQVRMTPPLHFLSSSFGSTFHMYMDIKNTRQSSYSSGL